MSLIPFDTPDQSPYPESYRVTYSHYDTFVDLNVNEKDLSKINSELILNIDDDLNQEYPILYSNVSWSNYYSIFNGDELIYQFVGFPNYSNWGWDSIYHMQYYRASNPACDDNIALYYDKFAPYRVYWDAAKTGQITLLWVATEDPPPLPPLPKYSIFKLQPIISGVSEGMSDYLFLKINHPGAIYSGGIFYYQYKKYTIYWQGKKYIKITNDEKQEKFRLVATGGVRRVVPVSSGTQTLDTFTQTMTKHLYPDPYYCYFTGDIVKNSDIQRTIYNTSSPDKQIEAKLIVTVDNDSNYKETQKYMKNE